MPLSSSWRDGVVSQGHALNRGVLTEAVIDAWARRSAPVGNHLFGKETCPHCVRAKGYLAEAGMEFAYHDVVRDPRALYEMLARVKPIVGPKDAHHGTADLVGRHLCRRRRYARRGA